MDILKRQENPPEVAATLARFANIQLDTERGQLRPSGRATMRDVKQAYVEPLQAQPGIAAMPKYFPKL